MIDFRKALSTATQEWEKIRTAERYGFPKEAEGYIACYHAGYILGYLTGTGLLPGLGPLTPGEDFEPIMNLPENLPADVRQRAEELLRRVWEVATQIPFPNPVVEPQHLSAEAWKKYQARAKKAAEEGIRI